MSSFTTTKIPVGTEYTVLVNNKKQVRQTTSDTVLLKDSNGAVVGVFNNEVEAEQAKPFITYNLEQGRVPAKLLKIAPPHRRSNNRQSSNKNKQQQNRRK